MVRTRTLSAVVFCRTVMFAVPTSPLVLNFTPSLVAVITTAAAGNKGQQKTATDSSSKCQGDLAEELQASLCIESVQPKAEKFVASML
jgi:hypothetical protein